MTERKPPGVPFESWVDKQIRDAEERGAFADLPGAGKPLPSLNTPYDELWWIRGKMQREGLSVLPPTLLLRKEAEDAVAAVAAARSERQVRQILADVNARIEAAIRRPPQGPPLNLRPFDVEQAVADWRAAQQDRRPGEQDDPRHGDQRDRRPGGKRTRGLAWKRRLGWRRGERAL